MLCCFDLTCDLTIVLNPFRAGVNALHIQIVKVLRASDKGLSVVNYWRHHVQLPEGTKMQWYPTSRRISHTVVPPVAVLEKTHQ